MRARDEDEIRYIVGRDLEPSELETFDTLQAITPAVELMTATIAARARILAFKYLCERVPGSDDHETLHWLQQIQKRHSQSKP
jgi:hypothetical protein